METNNETVANVRDDMLQVVADEFGFVTMAQSDFVDYAERFVAANKLEILVERHLADEYLAAKDEEIAKLNRKVYEYEKLLASSPIGLIYQLGICNQDGDVMNGIGILFTNEAERAKMPRVGHGDKFYVVPYKESEVKHGER